MKNRTKLSRRDVTKQIGMVAGAVLVTSSVASAAVPTPKQVEGPFHPIDEQSDTDLNLLMIDGHSEPAKGEVILVRGRVIDTDGRPLKDALVDIWQANYFGRYSHPEDPNPAPLDPNFQGWGLITTDSEGRYGFKTIKPGPYPLSFLGEEGWRCRHVHFQVSRRSFSKLTTQMYFHGDPLIEQDLEIAKAPKELRHLLIAKSKLDEVTGLPLYQFDIVMDLAKA
jgi:protocatechuate 3,4-dioxygenase beta subunit